MVLEGLKRAEKFIELLRSAGYQRPDGKLLKAEHFDKDFENRTTSPALNSLCNGLKERLLGEEEVYQLEYLVNLGLFDGLLENMKVEETPKPVSSLVSARVENLNDACDSLEELIQAQIMEEALLLKELDDLNVTMDFDSFNCDQLEQFSSLNNNLEDSLSNQALQLIHKVNEIIQGRFEDLFTPFDSGDVLRFKTIENETLLLYNWHDEEYEFYFQKVSTAIHLLNEAKIQIHIEDVLQGEYELRSRRQQYQLETLKELLRLTEQLFACTILITITLERHHRVTATISKMIKDVLYGFNNLCKPIEQYIQSSSKCQFIINNPSLCEKWKDLDIIIERLKVQLKNLQKSQHTAESILGNLINEESEIEPLPKPTKIIEEELRNISLKMSESLSNVTTVSSRTRLLFPH